MTNQPKALKLADELEMWTLGEPAAEELRRLHAENEALRDKNNQLHTEINTAWQEVKTEQRLSFRTQVAKLESKVEADEALLRQALEALVDNVESPNWALAHGNTDAVIKAIEERLNGLR